MALEAGTAETQSPNEHGLPGKNENFMYINRIFFFRIELHLLSLKQMRSVGVCLLVTIHTATMCLGLPTSRSLRWVGDVWLPPKGKLYSIPEIQKTFERRRVLVLGDSLARRLTATLALIVNDEGSNDLLDSAVDEGSRLNRGGHGHYEWSVPSGVLRYQWTPHARDIASYVDRTDISNYTDVIIAIGVHDAERPSTVSIEDDINSALRALVSSGANVIWRTAPNMDDPRNPIYTKLVNTRLRKFNSIVMNAEAPGVCVIDVASTLATKSMGQERLKGDTPEHFGNIARMVEIQTITHSLTNGSAKVPTQ